MAESGPAFLEVEREKVEEALSAVVACHLPQLDDRLAGPAGYALSTTGKRLRPILCLAAYRAGVADQVPPAVYRLACALEIVHTYSLVHDDLPCMDDDDFRR